MSGPRHGRDGRGSTPLDEELLRRALRPLRPDPEQFLRGVRERIAEGEAGTPARARAPWLRSAAAAIVPPGLVRDELLGAAVGVSGKSALTSFAGALLLAPALSLVAVTVTFLLALLRLRKSGRTEPRPIDESTGLSALADPAGGGVVYAIAGAYLVCWFLAPALTLGVLAASMAGLTWLLGRLARRGLTSRLVVGTSCGQLLFWLALFGSQFAQYHPDGYLASAPPALFALGALGCGLLTLRSWARADGGDAPESERMPADRWPSARQGAQWHALVHVVLASILVLYLVPLAMQAPAGRARLVSHVEEFDAASKSPQWASWSLVAVHLLRDGGPPPDLGSVARGLHARLDRGERVDPYTLRWAARADLLRPGDWAALHDPAGLERLVRGSGRIPFLEQQVVPILAGERAGVLEAAARARLVERLVASIPAEPVHDGVGESLAAVETLEALGARQAVLELRAPIHTQLSASWSGATRTRVPTGFSVMVPDERISSAPFFYTNPTFEALELAARVGLPADVDPRRVRRFLEDAARSPHLAFLRRDHNLVAAAALRRLEGLSLVGGPDAVEWLARSRALLPAALLVLLCLIATVLAPARTRRAG